MRRPDLVSRRFRTRLMDAFSGCCVLREIQSEFEDGGIMPSMGVPTTEHSGARRTMVQSYYDSIDFSDLGDLRLFMGVASSFMRQLERQRDSPYDIGAAARIEELIDELRQSGFAYVDGAVVPIAAATRLDDARDIAITMDAVHLQQQIARIERAVDVDPALAIGTAKELVETVAKTILNARGVPFDAAADLPALSKLVFKALRQLPEDVPDAARGRDIIKRMLQQLAAAPQALAELRQLFGTGHGKDGRARGLRARHAKLAVGAAATLATYLLETHLEDIQAAGPVTGAVAR